MGDRKTLVWPSHEVTGVSFSTLDDESIKRTSVKRITSSAMFDPLLRNPIDGGLYDPALGPLENQDVCITCGLKGAHCPGHLGHVELPLTVYHPMYFDYMFKLVRATCLNCHKFKCADIDIYLLLLQHRLLDHHLVVPALELAEVLTSVPASESSTASLKQKLDSVFQQAMKTVPLPNSNSKRAHTAVHKHRNIHAAKYRNEINIAFNKLCMAKPRCAVSQGVEVTWVERKKERKNERKKADSV